MQVRLSDDHRQGWAEYVAKYDGIPLSAITMAEQEPTAVYLARNFGGFVVETVDSDSGFFIEADLSYGRRSVVTDRL